MATLETMTADRMEERINDTVEKVTGHLPQNLEYIIEENKLVWR
jgi:regulator of replication initiation timing